MMGRSSHDYGLCRGEHLSWLRESFDWQAADRAALLDFARFRLSIRLQSGQSPQTNKALVEEAVAIADGFAAFSRLLLEHFQAILFHQLGLYLSERGPAGDRPLATGTHEELAELQMRQRQLHERLKREHDRLMEQLSRLKLKLDPAMGRGP